MGNTIQVEIQGIDHLIHRLRQARPAFTRRYLRNGIRKSLSVVNKGAKTLVRVGKTGQTKRSLGVKVKVYARAHVVFGVVEPRPGFRIPVEFSWRAKKPGAALKYVAVRWHDPRKLAHLIERGTKPRATKSGAGRGRVPPRPFLERSFVYNEGRIDQIFDDVLEEALAAL